MSKLRKIFILVGVILAVPFVLFFVGFIGALFGVYEPSEPVKKAVVEAEVVEVTPSIPAVVKEERSESAVKAIGVPDEMGASETFKWLEGQGFISLKTGVLALDFDKFSRLSLEDSLTLHKKFKMAAHAADIKHSTPETEAEKSRYSSASLLVFAGACALSDADRRIFAKKAGAVFPPSAFHNGMFTGEYFRLLQLRSMANVNIPERVFRDYALIMTDKEIIAVLSEIGAITLPSSAYQSRRNKAWKLHPGEALSTFDIETLQAFHDAIDDTVFGDRRDLRRKIRKIIAGRHTADDLP